MFDFLFVSAIVIGFDALSIGALLGYLIPVDPARLPRVVAWLQTGKDPRRGSPIPQQAYRFAVSLMAVAVVAYSQWAMIDRLVVAPPPWALAYGPARLIVFAIVEVLLLGWTAFLVWVFRRAAVPSR